ncbi:hypothetical protein BH10ACT8_BH10ACT8_02740 [soil metagenome]|jgi:8-oxo-dGTP diphosphatase
MGSGDGWTICSEGHRHWGRFGAAGLLVLDAGRVILQQRAPWTHEGDSWGIPGGARDAGESAAAAALREANEEAGLDPQDIEPIGLYIVDHGGWAYTTVLARPRRPLRPIAANAESVTVEWIPVTEVENLVLHRGFAAAWPQLQQTPDPVRLLLGPEVRDAELLAELNTEGVSAESVSDRIEVGSLHRLLVRLEMVLDRAHADHVMAAGPPSLQNLVVLDEQSLRALR